MAYATSAQVEGLLSQLGDLSADTSITAPEIAQVGVQVDAEINVCLAGRGIGVPFVSDGTAVQNEFASFLTSTSAEGMAARVLKSVFPDATGAGETPAYAFHERLYRDNLKGLKDGSLIPLSLKESSATVAPSTMNTRNPDGDEDLGAVANPAFSRTMSDKW